MQDPQHGRHSRASVPPRGGVGRRPRASRLAGLLPHALQPAH